MGKGEACLDPENWLNIHQYKWQWQGLVVTDDPAVRAGVAFASAICVNREGCYLVSVLCNKNSGEV